MASLLLFVARFRDALIDPVMGMVADRTRGRWGKFRPYLLFVPILFAVTYAVPDLAGPGKRFWK